MDHSGCLCTAGSIRLPGRRSASGPKDKSQAQIELGRLLKEASEGRTPETGVELDIKGGRHYTASQLLAGGFDLRNTAARLGHSGGGATTLRHYADPVSEVDRRAAAYLA